MIGVLVMLLVSPLFLHEMVPKLISPFSAAARIVTFCRTYSALLDLFKVRATIDNQRRNHNQLMNGCMLLGTNDPIHVTLAHPLR